MFLRYIVKRFLIMIPTVLLISIISFIIINLPPGNMFTAYVSRLETHRGVSADINMAEVLTKSYGLDKPLYVQYGKWLWKFMHGDMGFSLITEAWEPVWGLIRDRLALTLVITLLSTVFVWGLGIPIGIYSALRQYSVGDYIFTFIGFAGLAIPGFLLALVFMYLGYKYLGISVGGLFSLDYAQAGWSFGKVIDLLKHIWIPALIVGLGGTCGLIRIMRANLLDEIRKPYVITARAKGLAEGKLIFRYPVRIAINPFLSTAGWMLPALFSGEAIVSTVLNIPSTGPLLLRALLGQDMYLAASFIMILSILTVIGTFISDILLAIADPRIRLG